MCTDTYMYAWLYICLQVYVYIYTYGTLAFGCKERDFAFPAYFMSSEAPELRQPSKPTMLCDNTLPICKVNDVSVLEKVGDTWKNKYLLWLYKWVLVHKMNHRDYVNYVWAQTAWKGRD